MNDDNSVPPLVTIVVLTVGVAMALGFSALVVFNFDIPGSLVTDTTPIEQQISHTSFSPTSPPSTSSALIRH